MGGLPAAPSTPDPPQGLVLNATVLLLVRHGVTDATGKRLYGRTPGVHLSERGRVQADAVAERLAALPIRAVYTSPLERCRETAAPIARALGLRVRTDRGVLETDIGAWTGRTFGQIRRFGLWRQILTVPSSARFPQGESLAEVQARTVKALEAIASRHQTEIVVVVSHGDPIRLALAHYAGAHLDHFQRLEVAPGSVSAVAIGGLSPRVLRVNDTGDLSDLLPRRTPRR
ncbi:MAG: MSMEG_4193 family putative phosphomutase [Actinomycetota bacterium]